jgi:hypothetical protein
MVCLSRTSPQSSRTFKASSAIDQASQGDRNRRSDCRRESRGRVLLVPSQDSSGGGSFEHE